MLVSPHNEHRIALTRLYSLALLEANGQWDPRLQMTANALIAVGIAVFLGILLSHIFGSRRASGIHRPPLRTPPKRRNAHHA